MPRCLVVVDVQRDFLPGGALAVPKGNEVIPVINQLIPKFDFVVATQDWHPPGHLSFASQHEGKQVGETVQLGKQTQIMWPDHCVQGTPGAEFAEALNTSDFDGVVQKGTNREIDSYSGFFDNGHMQQTELDAWLRERGITELYVVGLATDYCVKFTVLDAIQLGWPTTLIPDACRGVGLQRGDVDAALAAMTQAGALAASSSLI